MRSTRVLAVACTASLIEASSSIDAWPTPSNPPKFSFDTLGGMSFVHAWRKTDFTEADLQLLTRHNVVQFDKAIFSTSMSGASTEDRLIEAGKLVKAHDPTVKTLFYMNGLLNFPASRMYDTVMKDNKTYLLQNTTGDFVITNNLLTLDMQSKAMRQLFIENAQRGLEEGGFDGIFIDRANNALQWEEYLEEGKTGNQKGWDLHTAKGMVEAQTQLLDELQTTLTNSHYVVAKESIVNGSKDWQFANAAMPKDAFCSSYKPKSGNDETEDNFNKETCLEQIYYMQHVSRRPMLLEAHAMGPKDDEAARQFTMACFLVAAGELSYFSYADWDYSWSVDGIHWWPEYDMPLGKPLGDAKQDGWRFSRAFASGTTVEVDLQSRTANISWASSTMVV